MLVYRGYKTELAPNKKQKTKLAQNAGAARFAYNWALNIKQTALRDKVKVPNFIELSRELNKLKKTELAWMYDASKCSPQEALKNCDVAFDNFFRRCKQGKGKKGFPRFKSKKSGLGSFRLTGSIKVSSGHIQLPRLGKLKLKERDYLPINAKILSATVSEQSGKWFVSLRVEETIEIKPKSESVVGIDLGIKTLATCSDGQTFSGPKALNTNLSRLKRCSKQLSRKVKGSNNQKKVAKRLAKIHRRITNIRKDSLNKITTHLAKTKSKIVIEDLDVSGMIKDKRLSRAISDVGLFEFRRQLEYKGKWYGCEIVLADRFFPSSKSCSKCGWIKDTLTLKDRVFNCDSCGLEIDRDFNASLNLESYTVSSTGINAYGEESSGLACSKTKLSS